MACRHGQRRSLGWIDSRLERGDSGVRSSQRGNRGSAGIQSRISTVKTENRLGAACRKGEIGCFDSPSPVLVNQRHAHRARKVGKRICSQRPRRSMWITAGSIADVAVIGPRWKTKTARLRFAAFLVKKIGRLSSQDVHGKWSLRASSVTSGLRCKRRTSRSEAVPKSEGLKSQGG